MPKKQSSSRLSTIAGRVLKNLKSNSVRRYIGLWQHISIADVRALAASVLSQDETPGQRKRVTTITVKPGRDYGWYVLEGKVWIKFSQTKKEAITLAKQQAARLRPSRVKVGAKIVKEFR